MFKSLPVGVMTCILICCSESQGLGKTYSFMLLIIPGQKSFSALQERSQECPVTAMKTVHRHSSNVLNGKDILEDGDEGVRDCFPKEI